MFLGLLLEGGARLFQWVRNRDFSDALYGVLYRDYFFLGWSFKPNSGGAWQAIKYMRINSMGFRGREFSVARPPGTYRILAFGASTSHAGNYPEKLERLLNADQHGQKVEVINAAVPAWNTTQNLIQLITRGSTSTPTS